MAIADIGYGVLAVWFIFEVVLHELGHYVGYRLYGIKPKVKLRWFGVTIGEEEDFFRVTPKQWLLIAWLGPITGLLYTYLVFPAEWGLFWLVVATCIIDFGHILFINVHWKEAKKAKTYGHLHRKVSLEDYYKYSDLMEEVYEGRTLAK